MDDATRTRTLKAMAAAKMRDSEPQGRVGILRSFAMPDGSRINVVRKDVMDHALGRVPASKP